MQKPDAQIVCRKTEYGPVAHWTGGKRATVNREAITAVTGEMRILPGTVFEFGRLTLRVVSFPFFTHENSGYCDQALVMLESPHAQLFWLYREKAEQLIRIVSSLEARIWSGYRGFRLRPSPEGELLRVTSVLADYLL